jgi:predicted acylesterase/phospholipase RssA
MDRPETNIGLALSGGGFRATLFHLGVIRFLAEIESLKSIKLVSAVSGGSILAAHLVLNWEKYNDLRTFDDVAREVIGFVQQDVRGRILRKWVLGCLTIFPRFLLPKRSRWSLGNLLQRAYSRLFREATIKKLRGPNRPGVRFNCTSLTSGSPCFFDQSGFAWYKDSGITLISALDLPVAYAVAASSAFPPLFPPVEISNQTLSCDKDDFENTHRLTDGGVYDNLGIETLSLAKKAGIETIFISDAEGNFDSDFDNRYSL